MADISLLDDVQPNHPKLTRFSRDPKRYADEILYTLLDFCDEEEITGNREFHEGTDDGSSNTSTEEESKEPSGDSPEEPSDTASDAPSDTSEGDPSPGPDAHDTAGQDEDSKKK